LLGRIHDSDGDHLCDGNATFRWRLMWWCKASSPVSTTRDFTSVRFGHSNA
jgi:hypothetical protein